MGFRTGAYATIWEIKPNSGNYTDVRLSVSKKNKQTEQYETDFSGFVRLVGAAHQKGNTLKERDRIKIGDCDVTNNYSKEKNITYTNYVIFSFENVNGNGTNENQSSSGKQDDSGFVNIPNSLDEELPFN